MCEIFWRNYGQLCGAMRSLPCVCCPVRCACRNLRIRAEGTPDHAEAQASDLRGHWRSPSTSCGAGCWARLFRSAVDRGTGWVWHRVHGARRLGWCL